MLVFKAEIHSTLDNIKLVDEYCALSYSAIIIYTNALLVAWKNYPIQNEWPSYDYVRVSLLESKIPVAVGRGGFTENGRFMSYFFIKSMSNKHLTTEYPIKELITIESKIKGCERFRIVKTYSLRSRRVAGIGLGLLIIAILVICTVLLNVDKKLSPTVEYILPYINVFSFFSVLVVISSFFHLFPEKIENCYVRIILLFSPIVAQVFILFYRCWRLRTHLNLTPNDPFIITYKQVIFVVILAITSQCVILPLLFVFLPIKY